MKTHQSKIFLLVLTLLMLSMTSLSSFGQFWKPDYWKQKQKKEETPVQVEKKEPSKTNIQEAKEVVKQLNSELTQARESNKNLKENLVKAENKLKQSEEKTIEVQKQADNLKEWGIIQQAQAQKFMEKYNNAVKRYHRLKLIAAAIAAAVGVLLGLQFMSLAPPPYNLGVPVGAAGLFAALVWFLL